MKQPEALPYKIVRFCKVDSTNRIALEMGSREAIHGTVILAEEQMSGRGRLSRDFSSPQGGLYMSVILQPNLAIEKMSLITLAAGLVCAQVIIRETGVQVQLKWPNDLYSHCKKIGGILAEAAPYSHFDDSIPFVVVGIGLNINTRLELFPGPLKDFVSSLYSLAGGREFNIDKLVHEIVTGLLAEVLLLEREPRNILARWQAMDYLKGKKLKLQEPGGRIVSGIGGGLLPDGRYRLTTMGGDDYPVLAGDIVITQINGKNIK